MGRLAGFHYREIVRKLKRCGFEFDRQAAGSHEIWFNAIPDEQPKFCETVQDYRAANIRFSNEANPIKRAEMRKPNPYDWEERIVGVLGTSGRFDNWTGTVRFHVDGRHVGISFFPNCQGAPQAIEFATAGHYVFGSKDSNTMIPLHSPLADTLGQTKPNQTVIASGHLFYLAHGNLGNYSTGQKAELRQRYKGVPNYPPASVASPRLNTAKLRTPQRFGRVPAQKPIDQKLNGIRCGHRTVLSQFRTRANTGTLRNPVRAEQRDEIWSGGIDREGYPRGLARVALMGSKRGYLGVFFSRKLLKNIYPLSFRF